MTEPIPHGTPSGYRRHKCRCDECRAWNAARMRAYYAANPDKVNENNRRWKQANADQVADYHRHYRSANREHLNSCVRRRREANPEKKLEEDRAWREVNREKTLESGRRWRAANPDKAKEQLRRWREANPERHADIGRQRSHRYRARKIEAFVEDVPRLEIFERDGWQCRIPGCLHPGVPASLNVPCHDPIYASIDHVIPLSKGGKHERSNLVCSHLQCNRTKRDRLEGIA